MDDLDLFGVFQSDTSEKPAKRNNEGIEKSKPVKKPKSTPTPEVDEIEPEIPAVPSVNTQKDTLSNDSKFTLHEEVLPLDGEVQPSWTPNPTPAKTYSFPLDPFQAKSIEFLEKGESVLVTAHTSAGKTAVAEYAIAMALRDKQRVIYTSPIKALSNQKYRDLHEEFNDVGLMTGDVTISPNASCLVMTTEILRSMLYRGSEILREVAWVIYDEIHYMRDLERGVVWEESIVLLPHKVRYVFLSATIPNGKEFAGWIADTHHQKVHVLYTEFRPTPLQHYIYTSGSNGLYLVLDETGKFREKNFQKAVSTMASGELEEQVMSKNSKKQSKTTTESNLKQIVKLIMDKNYDPVIIFSFSKKECEGYGNVIAQDCYTTKDEQKMIKEVYQAAIDGLSDEDKRLPQVNSMLPLLMNGVGIHHGGLLPILKEIIEILFQEGLLKVLFATETFAMGVNMPARTVVFTNIKKYDGKDFRLITSGEYIQMSGRAGRRGKDLRGIVIQMLDEKIEPNDVKSILKGDADPLNSSFYLGYNMLLNLMRVEDADPEYIIKHSFYQYQKQQKAPLLLNKIHEIESELSKLSISDDKNIGKHYALTEKIKENDNLIRRMNNSSPNLIKFLICGRLVEIKSKNNLFDWGCVLQCSKSTISDVNNPDNICDLYTVDVLLYCDPDSTKDNPLPCPPTKRGNMLAINVTLSTIYNISSIILQLDKDLKSVHKRNQTYEKIKEVKKRFNNNIPLLNPVKDLKINESKIGKLIENQKNFEEEIRMMSDVDVNSKDYKDYVNRIKLEEKKKNLKLEVKYAEELALTDQLKMMKRVLRRLEYIDDKNVVLMKGKVACEINASDELLLTELIFDNVFNDLTIPQLCGLLSMLVFEEKCDENIHVPQDMLEVIKRLEDSARRLGQVLIDAKMELDLEEYVHKYKPAVVDIVYGWAKGDSFSEICKKNDSIYEGSVIRCIRREEELLRELIDASHAIGNNDLESKFTEAIKCIKRDIVFAASLYLN